MTLSKRLLPEFDREMASTRKVLERLPDDKLDWRAHPKSNTIGWNANHLAEIAGYFLGVLTRDSWDINPVGGPAYESPSLGSRAEILELFDKNVAASREALAAASDDSFDQEWSFLNGGEPIFTMRRYEAIRIFVLNHTIHHRAILTVSYRLNDVPVPGIYGPSGDEAG